MSIQVKICGITSADAADAAMKSGAEFVGLNFFPASPRNLKPEQAAALAARMRNRSRLVVLLADARDEEIAVAVSAAKPDFLQLHGRENPERIAAVRVRFGLPVIKAISVADADDLAEVSAFEKVADMLLFDAKPPVSASRPGGHGAAFDWQLLRGRTFARPWLLAGGLTAENVGRAIRSAEAPGVDVSSGVELAPGLKSADMIRDFVAAVRATEFAREPQA
jgi:phosphoribosylanthranilate isomerase